MKKPRLETIANWMIVVTGLVALGTTAHRWLGARSTAAQGPKAVYQPGENVDAGPAVDFSRSNRTLLVSIDTGCPHCASVMPFLKDVARDAQESAQVVVVGLQPVGVLREYLARHSIDGVPTVQLKPGTLRARAVPTMIVVDWKGRFLSSRTGRLNEADQDAVRAALDLPAEAAQTASR